MNTETRREHSPTMQSIHLSIQGDRRLSAFIGGKILLSLQGIQRNLRF